MGKLLHPAGSVIRPPLAAVSPSRLSLGRYQQAGVQETIVLRVELGREKVLPLHPLEAFMLGYRSDLNRAADRLWAYDRVLNESDCCFDQEPSQIDRILNRCSGQNQAFERMRK